MFYRVFGRSGYGKTSYVYGQLKKCIENGGKAFLIVPEQCAVSAEKDVIRKLSGKSNLYVEVINFKRLANRVFRSLGGLTAQHLDEGAKKMLMLLTLDKISPFLGEYKTGAALDGFCDKALEVCENLKTFRVSPAELEEAGEKIKALPSGADSGSKLCDLATIAEAYYQKSDEVCSDDADIYARLCLKLRSNPFFCGCDVFFDSFYGFTAAEYEIISLIAEQADNTYITFACDMSEKDPMFKRSIDAAKKCRKIAESVGCEIKDVTLTENLRHTEASAIKAFERQFRSSRLGSFESECDCDASLMTVECEDIHDEVRYACDVIQELVRSGESYSDITVCARNTQNYLGIIDTAFEKSGIPLGIDVPRPFNRTALYELMMSALDGAADFVCEDVIRYIKTGLSGLDEEEADTLEEYLHVWNVSPSHFKADEDFTMNPDGYVEGVPDDYTLRVVNRARSKVFVCLDGFKRNLAGCRTVEDYCTAVYSLLTDIKNVSDESEINDGDDGEALELLCKMLDSLVNFGGGEEISYQRFVSLFSGCSGSYEYAHIPSRCDEVRFSDITLMRSSNTGHVIVLGAASGVFPASPSDAGLITGAEKKLLHRFGTELGYDDSEAVYDELFLAYNAICGARKSVRVLYGKKSPSGEEQYPSVIISAIEKITKNPTISSQKTDEELCFAGNERLFEELMRLGTGKKRNTLLKYFSAIPEYVPRLELLKGTFTQKDRLEAETLGMLYGDTLITSYSRLEKFRGCPFAHFCTYTLRLKPRADSELGPAEAGSVMHGVLEELVPILCREKDDGTYPTEDEAVRLAAKLLSERLESITHVHRSKLSKRFVYLYERLARLLESLARNIVRELRVTKFRPADFELSVSETGDVKPVPIDIGGGCTLYIVGRVDRVDIYEKGDKRYIRIVDYKTGRKAFKMKEIKMGFNLQMLLYLEALRQRGGERYGGDVLPAGVLYSNVVSSNKSMSLGDGIEEEAGRLIKPCSSGVFLDDEDVLFAMDGGEKKIFLPVTEKNSAETLRNAEELGELLDFAVVTASELAREIRAGLKSVSPFDGTRTGIDINPCEYCEMKAICGKE